MNFIVGFVLNLCLWKHISKFIAPHLREEILVGIMVLKRGVLVEHTFAIRIGPLPISISLCISGYKSQEALKSLARLRRELH
jgi:hypothetical protein